MTVYSKKIQAHMDNLDKLEFEATLTNKKLKSICSDLKAAGIKVVKVEEGDMDVDASIQLENRYEIQVGHGYLLLNKHTGSGDDFGVKQVAEAKNIKDLIPKIKKALEVKAEHEYSFKTLKEVQVGRANDIHVSLIAWSDTHLKSNPDKKKYSISCNHDHRGLLGQKSTQSLADAEKTFTEMVKKYTGK